MLRGGSPSSQGRHRRRCARCGAAGCPQRAPRRPPSADHPRRRHREPPRNAPGRCSHCCLPRLLAVHRVSSCSPPHLPAVAVRPCVPRLVELLVPAMLRASSRRAVVGARRDDYWGGRATARRLQVGALAVSRAAPRTRPSHAKQPLPRAVRRPPTRPPVSATVSQWATLRRFSAPSVPDFEVAPSPGGLPAVLQERGHRTVHFTRLAPRQLEAWKICGRAATPRGAAAGSRDALAG